MPDQGILDYIRSEKARGIDAATTRNELLKAGWKASEVDVAFRAMTPEPTIKHHPTAPAVEASAKTEHKMSPTAIALEGIPKFRPKKWVFELLAIIVILLAGISIACGYYYYLSPYLVINQSINKLSEVKTFEYSLEIANTDNTNKYDNFTLRSSGTEDLTDLSNTKSSITLSGTSADGANFANPIGFQVEYRNIGHNIYAKVDKLDGLEDIAAPIIDKWINFDLTPVKKLYDLEKTDKQASGNNDEVSDKQRAEISRALKNDNVFDFSERLLNEKVNNIDTTHYLLTLNKDEFLKLYIDTAKILFDREFTEKNIQSMEKDLLSLGSTTIEIWVGKEDSLPYKIVGSSQILDTKTMKPTGGSTLTLNFKNFNKDVSITAPTETMTFQEAFSLIFK